MGGEKFDITSLEVISPKQSTFCISNTSFSKRSLGIRVFLQFRFRTINCVHHVISARAYR